jgi:hypothetical protein
MRSLTCLGLLCVFASACAEGTSDIDDGSGNSGNRGPQGGDGGTAGGSAGMGGDGAHAGMGGDGGAVGGSGGVVGGSGGEGGVVGGSGGVGGMGTAGMGGVPPTCGDGVIDAGETCDGMVLGGATCAAFGYVSGSLSCSPMCQLVSTACYTCGDGTITGAEVCDGMNLGGQSCVGFGHDGGTLLCNGNCLGVNETACSDCGDSVVEGTEQCDLANLNGASCTSLGLPFGSLACTAACTFNTAGCIGTQCSDTADNDVDGFIDLNDPGCTSAMDTDEAIFAANCAGLGGPIYDVTYANTGLDVIVTGTTSGGVNNFGPTDLSDDCTTATGPEVILFYRVFSTLNNVIFSFNPATTAFDTVMYIRQASCSSPTVELCNDDFFYPFDVTSYLAVNMPPGDYFIFIDGYGGGQGNFELTIDLP